MPREQSRATSVLKEENSTQRVAEVDVSCMDGCAALRLSYTLLACYNGLYKDGRESVGGPADGQRMVAMS